VLIQAPTRDITSGVALIDGWREMNQNSIVERGTMSLTITDCARICVTANGLESAECRRYIGSDGRSAIPSVSTVPPSGASVTSHLRPNASMRFATIGPQSSEVTACTVLTQPCSRAACALALRSTSSFSSAGWRRAMRRSTSSTSRPSPRTRLTEEEASQRHCATSSV